MQNSYLDGESIVWNYLEKKDVRPNDAIHHGFILEGIYDYQKFRMNEKIPLNDNKYTSFLYKCIKDNMIYSSPDYLKDSCFNTGAIRWISSKDEQREILIKSSEVYPKDNTTKRQLTFLLDAYSLYLSSM